jgi:rubrerythrin
MGFSKDYKDKEFICRQCNSFLDSGELIEGNCPDCETDEYLFHNDLDED